MTAGFYSVVQFCPDLARGEVANVGIVVALYAAKQPRIITRFAPNNERIKELFGSKSYVEQRVNAAKSAIETRLQTLAPSRQAIETFAGSLGNNLLLTPLRPIAVDEARAEAEADDLFEELVGTDFKATRQKTVPKPDIASAFNPLFSQGIEGLERDVHLVVPLLNVTLDAPVAWTNGKRNCAHAHGFPAKETKLREHLEALSSQGQLIAESEHEGRAQRLVVVANFENPADEGPAGDLLTRFKVRLVLNRDLDALVDEVRREAHR